MRKNGKKREPWIYYCNSNILLSESRGLRVHVEALKGTRLSWEPPWLRQYRVTMEGLQYSLRGQPGQPESCLIGKWVKVGVEESGVLFQRWGLTHSRTSSGHTKHAHRGTAIPTVTQWHAFSHWASTDKPYKDRSKFVCRVPISISRF